MGTSKECQGQLFLGISSIASIASCMMPKTPIVHTKKRGYPKAILPSCHHCHLAGWMRKIYRKICIPFFFAVLPPCSAMVFMRVMSCVVRSRKSLVLVVLWGSEGGRVFRNPRTQGLTCRAISFSCLHVDFVIWIVMIIIQAAQIQGTDQPVTQQLERSSQYS